MKKRLLAAMLASFVGLTGCAGSGASSSSGSSSAESSASSDASSASSVSSAAGEAVVLPPFAGFDPAAKLSEDETAAMIKAAYEGTGEFAPDKLPTAEIETSAGTIKIRLFPQFAPKAVENFMKHAKDGYYDNTKFHRVIENFMIQGGDPKGNGTGGESIWKGAFEDELNVLLHHFPGALSMANSGPNSNGSQFFIVQGEVLPMDEIWGQMEQVIYSNRLLFESYARLLDFIDGKGMDIATAQGDPELNKAMESVQAELDAAIAKGVPEAFTKQMSAAKEIYAKVGGVPNLDYKHTVFGYLYEGMDVVNKIAAMEKDENDMPKENVLIKKITLTDPTGILTASGESGASSSEATSAAASSEASSAAASSAASSTAN